MSHQLLPCPFCGGAAICVQVFEKPMPRFGCSACGMFKLSSTAWNTRAIASVKREPLSDDQIETIWESHKYKLSGWDYDGMSVMQETDFEKAARAIEQAHGITATTASRDGE